MATYVRQQEIGQRIGSRGRLQLKVTDADVRLRPSDNDEVRLRATFEIGATSDEEADAVLEASKLLVSAGSGHLDVRSPDNRDRGSLKGALGIPDGATLRRWITGEPRISLSVEGEVPPDAEVRVETVSGDLVIKGMHGEQRYNTVSGDQFLEELGGTVRLNAVSGDATVRGDSPISLRAETVSGDLSVLAPRFEELRLSTVSGDLEVEGELAPRGEHRIESVSGDLRFGLVGGATFDVRGISTDVSAEMPHRLEGRLDRRRVIVGSGSPTVVFSSMSGDIALRSPRRLRRSVETDEPQAAGVKPASAAASADTASDSALEVLRALERGEIDVEEAGRRLSGGGSDA